MPFPGEKPDASTPAPDGFNVSLDTRSPASGAPQPRDAERKRALVAEPQPERRGGASESRHPSPPHGETGRCEDGVRRRRGEARLEEQEREEPGGPERRGEAACPARPGAPEGGRQRGRPGENDRLPSELRPGAGGRRLRQRQPGAERAERQQRE